MSKFTELVEILTSTFSIFKNISEIELRNNFFIYDYKGKSYIVKEIISTNNSFCIEINKEKKNLFNFDKTKIFTITNSIKTCFIPIDGSGGLIGNSSSSCDFVIFNENVFCFCELKLNATSVISKMIKKNRIDAVEQLKKTIDYFDKKLSGNYCGMHLEAYVATPEIYPRNNSSWETIRVKFLENKKINLFENDTKDFKNV